MLDWDATRKTKIDWNSVDGGVRAGNGWLVRFWMGNVAMWVWTNKLLYGMVIDYKREMLE